MQESTFASALRTIILMATGSSLAVLVIYGFSQNISGAMLTTALGLLLISAGSYMHTIFRHPSVLKRLTAIQTRTHVIRQALLVTVVNSTLVNRARMCNMIDAIQSQIARAEGATALRACSLLANKAMAVSKSATATAIRDGKETPASLYMRANIHHLQRKISEMGKDLITLKKNCLPQKSGER